MSAQEKPRAWGRNGYVREGLSDAIPGIRKSAEWAVKALLILAALIAGCLIVRWAGTEYWIATHCTTVLGTRVCQ